MYEAYLQNSDFVKANLILYEDKKGTLDGYHQMINGRNMVYQVAQLLHIQDKPVMQVYPVLEHTIQKLQMHPDDLKELAMINLKRFTLMNKDAITEELSRERRLHGRRK